MTTTTIQSLIDLNGKKFDVCLMNPPYDKNLHLKFLEKVITTSEKTVSIQPSIFLNKNKINTPIGKYRTILNGKIDEIEIIDHDTANNIFGTGNSIESLGIFVCKENGKIDLEHYGLNNIEESLLRKIELLKHPEVLTFNQCKYNPEYGDVKYKGHNIIRQENDVAVYTWHGGKSCYDAVIMSKERENSKKGVSLVLRFNSEKEVNNFKNSLKTHFMNWYYYTFVIPADHKLINYMFRLKDYSKLVTDETFYKIFNLTKEEIKIIKDFKIPE